MIKASSRKSTIDVKSRLLIARDSEEYKQMKLSESKKSRSTADLYNSSSSDDSDDGGENNGVGDPLAKGRHKKYKTGQF